MIQGLENLETKHKVKLTVPLVASYLARGVKRTKIAALCNISNQAVYDYCDRHYEELAPLIDISDSIMAMKSKHIAEKAQKRILIHLDESEKKDLFALNAISGTHIDKFRLLSDRSTSNVSIQAEHDNIKELDQREKLLEAKITAMRGNSEIVNQEDKGEKH
jgi:predicted DNA-binding protein YlxM (UPF0122 family)